MRLLCVFSCLWSKIVLKFSTKLVLKFYFVLLGPLLLFIRYADSMVIDPTVVCRYFLSGLWLPFQLRKTVVTCKIKHLQKCFSVLFYM